VAESNELLIHCDFDIPDRATLVLIWLASFAVNLATKYTDLRFSLLNLGRPTFRFIIIEQ